MGLCECEASGNISNYVMLIAGVLVKNTVVPLLRDHPVVHTDGGL